MSLLVTGIGQLVTNDPTPRPGMSPLGVFGLPAAEARLGTMADAALIVSGRHIVWSGPRQAAPPADRSMDLGGAAVVPGFVDSHTHLVFAGDRAVEFEARMTGSPYTGGGISVTVEATRQASDEALRAGLRSLRDEAAAQGTTTMEIKSGYGLEVGQEARLLRLAREVTEETTYLGAHVVPGGVQRDVYVESVCGPMLAACAPHARWADVFCEPHSPVAFDADEARAILVAAAQAGLGLRVHGNQLGHGPGVQLAVELGAASVDHCTFVTDEDIEALAATAPMSQDDGRPAAEGSDRGTVATLLPGVEYSTRMPYPDSQRFLEAGAVVALATDCNPGTCYSSSMPWVISLAVRELGMSAAEAVWSATRGGALALRRQDVGWLGPGSLAHLCVLDAPDYRHLAYRPGVPLARGLVLTD